MPVRREPNRSRRPARPVSWPQAMCRPTVAGRSDPRLRRAGATRSVSPRRAGRNRRCHRSDPRDRAPRSTPRRAHAGWRRSPRRQSRLACAHPARGEPGGQASRSVSAGAHPAPGSRWAAGPPAAGPRAHGAESPRRAAFRPRRPRRPPAFARHRRRAPRRPRHLPSPVRAARARARRARRGRRGSSPDHRVARDSRASRPRSTLHGRRCDTRRAESASGNVRSGKLSAVSSGRLR